MRRFINENDPIEPHPDHGPATHHGSHIVSSRPAEQIVLTLPPDPTLTPLIRLATAHFLRLSGLTFGRARQLAWTVVRECRADLRRDGRRGTERRRGRVALALRATADLCEAAIRSDRGRAWRSVLRIPAPRAT